MNLVQKDEKVARVKTVPLVKTDVQVQLVFVVKKVFADHPVKWVSDKRVNRENVVSLVSPVNLVDLVHPVKHVSSQLYIGHTGNDVIVSGSGPPGLPGEDGVCTQECAPQQQVSFFAGLSTNCNARGEAIPFDTVMTNQCQGCEGEAAQGAYDGETGSFTAPVDGTYVFHVNVLLRI